MDPLFSGEDWEAIKSRLWKSQGLQIDLLSRNITRIMGNTFPSKLKMIPIAFRNIAGSDAELTEVTGTFYKTDANAESAGMFALPVTPIGRIEPVKLRAKMRNASEKLLMNGEEEYSIDVNSAYVVIIIHKSGKYFILFMNFSMEYSNRSPLLEVLLICTVFILVIACTNNSTYRNENIFFSFRAKMEISKKDIPLYNTWELYRHSWQ